MMRRRAAAGALAAVIVFAAVGVAHVSGSLDRWAPDEVQTIASLALPVQPLAPPPNPSNRVADDPAAARLGRALFFDDGLSANGRVSCSTCHRPDRGFADTAPRSVGLAPGRRNTPSIAGAAFSPWQFWDGRRDSLWAQALVPLENAGEHGLGRVAIARRVAARWRAEYESVFGPLPALEDEPRFPVPATPLGTAEQAAAWEGMRADDQDAVDEVFANVGKALEAFERRLSLAPSRFDHYARALAAGDPEGGAALDDDEVAGLRIFLREGKCVTCHSGPLLTNHEFHSTGLPRLEEGGESGGRHEGVIEALRDPFNCLGPHSDASPEECDELRFVKPAGDELRGAMKVPGLRLVARTAPYMHDGRFGDLMEVVAHYAAAPEPDFGHSDLEPFDLPENEARQLVAFLLALDSEILLPADLALGGLDAAAGASE